MKILVFGWLGIFTILALAALAAGIAIKEIPLVLGIFLLYIPVWFWYLVLTIPHIITVCENNEIEFVSLIRRRRVKAMDISSIKATKTQFGFLELRHSGGKIRLLNQFNGFHRFIADLTAVNPAIELRGC